MLSTFPGDSEMAARMRAHPWADTPLGPPGDWPASLRTACRICLTSRFPMIVWWETALYMMYNDAYLPMLGTKHPALGRLGGEVWPEIWHIVGPMLDGVMASGQATWSEDLLLPVERHGYWEETYWTYSDSPLHDDEGVVRGVFTAVSETTERVVGERRLATLQDLAAQTGNARGVAEACRLVADALGRAAADVPFAAIYLRQADPDDLVLAAASPARPDLPDGYARPAGWPLAEVLASQRPTVVRDALDALHDLPGGSWGRRPVEAMVLPLPADTGGPTTGAIVLGASAGRRLDESYQTFLGLVAQHVAALINGALAYQSQQRRAEELAELDRAKTTFVANISHEFRTPLTLIMGPLRALRADLAGRAGLPSAELETMHRNGLRLGKLVNTLLDFSRIEAGRMPARFEPVDLASFTGELASVFRAAVERAGLDFEVDCAPLAEPVYLDPEMWEKVIFNLLSNAVKFTFDGRIGVSVAQRGDGAVVRVTDTGIGIGAAEMPRLFERFHRISNVRSRSSEGSGIGLALVRELIALHGGEITADSVEGEGTTFTIRLLFGRGHLPADTLAPAAGPTAVSEVVEPFLSEALRWSPAPDTAAEEPLVEPPDVVAEFPPDSTLSARAGQESAVQGLTAGADDYLVKPFSARELLAKVRSRVDLARLRDRHARWRSGLIDSLHEGFFVCDADGTVVEINATFTDILGYGAEGLPFPVPHPWWPQPDTEPEGYREVMDILKRARGDTDRRFVAPIRHRDGRRIWASVTCNEVSDPDTGRQMLVGTVRDVTAERFASRRAAAMTAISVRLGSGGNHLEVLRTAIEELRKLWAGRRALAVIRAGDGEVTLLADPPGVRWAGLPAEERAAIEDLRHRPVLQVSTLTEARARDRVTGAGASLGDPADAVAIWLELDPAYPFTDEDRTLLGLLCGYVGQALHRAQQFDQQREVAITFQRAILGPSQLPPGFAVRYEPATPPLEVGGDWYDVVELPDRTIGIVVGDCVGRGLSAATTMGQLRSACRALLLQAAGPAQTLTALDQFAAQVPGGSCTTVFCGVLDPATGTLVYSSAGHPPGILVYEDGRTELLDGGRFTPLAVRRETPRPEAKRTVPDGATLLLYTDGLVERRGSPLDLGIERAGATVRASRSMPVDELAEHLMTGLVPAGGYDDDVALLVYRRDTVLTITVTDARQLGRVRDTLRAWLPPRGLNTDEVQGVLVAVTEACANAVEHGYRNRTDCDVRMTATVTGRDLHIVVTDGGRWKPSHPRRNQFRGRGLTLMRALMHGVTVETGESGTRVTMRLEIGG